MEDCQHGLGLQIVADRFEKAGWNVRHLGEDVPVDALVDHVDPWRPDVLCLSISMPQQISAGHRTIQRTRERMGDRAPCILVGGRVLNQFPHLHKVLDADGWAPDSRRAVEAISDR